MDPIRGRRIEEGVRGWEKNHEDVPSSYPSWVHSVGIVGTDSTKKQRPTSRPLLPAR